MKPRTCNRNARDPLDARVGKSYPRLAGTHVTRSRALRALLALTIGAVLAALAFSSTTETSLGLELQRAAKSVSPAPDRARGDRGQLAADGCMVEQQTVRFPKCVYGDPHSRKTVVLFGDSQAMHWFPPLLRLARQHGWRLIGRTRAGCPPAAIHFANRCDRWRAGSLRRIERHDRPDLVVTGTGVAYQAVSGARRLSGAANSRAMRNGLARTLRRLRRTGAKVAVMKALTWAPNRIVTCVKKSPMRLRRCAFARKQPTDRSFDARAAKLVRGAKLIDGRPRICLRRICPAVIDDLLVYRDPYHLSATFARTLAPWLDRHLPRP